MASTIIEIKKNVNNQDIQNNPAAQAQQQQQTTTSNVAFKSIGAVKLASVAVNAAKSMGTFALSNYGNFTGDYIAQEKINNTFNMISQASSFGSSILGGALVGGVPGAIGGAIISGVNIAVNLTQDVISTNLTLARTNYTASANANRLGRIITNGSR